MAKTIDPCGTPVVIDKGSNMWWPNFTVCVLLERQDINHLQAEGENTYNLGFDRRL